MNYVTPKQREVLDNLYEAGCARRAYCPVSLASVTRHLLKQLEGKKLVRFFNRDGAFHVKMLGDWRTIDALPVGRNRSNRFDASSNAMSEWKRTLLRFLGYFA